MDDNIIGERSGLQVAILLPFKIVHSLPKRSKSKVRFGGHKDGVTFGEMGTEGGVCLCYWRSLLYWLLIFRFIRMVRSLVGKIGPSRLPVIFFVCPSITKCHNDAHGANASVVGESMIGLRMNLLCEFPLIHKGGNVIRVALLNLHKQDNHPLELRWYIG